LRSFADSLDRRALIAEALFLEAAKLHADSTLEDGMVMASELDLEDLVVHTHRVASHRLLSGPSQHAATRDVELAPVAGAGHDRALELTLGQGAAEVGTGVVEGVKRSAHVRYRNPLSADFESRKLTLTDLT
jgi:hypothetical protein